MNELAVTAEQMRDGYPEVIVRRRRYTMISKLPDGYYLVVDPMVREDSPAMTAEMSWSEKAAAHRDLAQRAGRSVPSLNDPQPMPAGGEGPDIWALVVDDMKERNEVGRRKYGQTLRAGDGRDHLIDAYQECLDMAVYLRQEIEERRIEKEKIAKLLDEKMNAAWQEMDAHPPWSPA